jgi:hypothetical protein
MSMQEWAVDGCYCGMSHEAVDDTISRACARAQAHRRTGAHAAASPHTALMNARARTRLHGGGKIMHGQAHAAHARAKAPAHVCVHIHKRVSDSAVAK